jgi:MFS family permease
MPFSFDREDLKNHHTWPPLRILLPVGIGTCLSLMGDASLYAVLPTHTGAAGVTVASVGVLLSANRFIRLVLNGPGGAAYDRWRRRRLFVPALFIGALSTALYGLTQGFWSLFVGRLLWGLAWVGIWIGGNTIVLDVADERTRGRWVGIYHISFFAGSAGGSLIGGILTDRIGYHHTMVVNACLTLAGALIALVLLPETRGLRSKDIAAVVPPDNEEGHRARMLSSSRRAGTLALAAAVALYGVHRLAVAGVLQSTFGLFLLEQLGEQVQVAGRTVGVATLTGLGLGLSTLIAAMSAPIVGGISDRLGNRWRVAAIGLIPGMAGFGLLALRVPLTITMGVPLVAITSGSNQGLSTALVGDLDGVGRQGRRLGLLFTVGDLASAIAPPLAYALIPLFGIRFVYLIIAGVFVLVSGVIFTTDQRGRALNRRREIDAGTGS